MAQVLNKGEHIFIPFHRNGRSVGCQKLHIYKSPETAMKNYGRLADEIVEYAPIIHCVDCKHFAPKEIEDENDWEGTCLYNECDVDTGDFCSCGEKRK